MDKWVVKAEQIPDPAGHRWRRRFTTSTPGRACGEKKPGATSRNPFRFIFCNNVWRSAGTCRLGISSMWTFAETPLIGQNFTVEKSRTLLLTMVLLGPKSKR